MPTGCGRGTGVCRRATGEGGGCHPWSRDAGRAMGDACGAGMRDKGMLVEPVHGAEGQVTPAEQGHGTE